MKPIGLIPQGYEADGQGQVLIGGRAADDLVAEAGRTPLFVYNAARIAAQVARFRAAFPSELALHYAVKANPYGPLLQAI
jgi:diaminopimelate decarboxylase